MERKEEAFFSVVRGKFDVFCPEKEAEMGDWRWKKKGPLHCDDAAGDCAWMMIGVYQAAF